MNNQDEHVNKIRAEANAAVEKIRRSVSADTIRMRAARRADRYNFSALDKEPPSSILFRGVAKRGGRQILFRGIRKAILKQVRRGSPTKIFKIFGALFDDVQVDDVKELYPKWQARGTWYARRKLYWNLFRIALAKATDWALKLAGLVALFRRLF